MMTSRIGCESFRYGGLLCLFMSCILSAATVLPASPLRVVQLSGLCQVLHKGDSRWVNCAAGMELRPGDRIRTSPGAVAGLVYPDGSRLRMKGSSSLQVLSSGYRLRYGRTWVRVVKQGGRFRTLTPNAVVSVKGTIYAVSCHRNLSALQDSLCSGAVSDGFVSAVPAAHLAGGELALSLLGLRNCLTEVKVYRGLVSVGSPGRRPGEKGSQCLLEAGHAVMVAGTVLSGTRRLTVPDYKEWTIGFSGLQAPSAGGGGRGAAGSIAPAAGGAGRPEGRRRSAGAIRLLDVDGR